jgi:hypothetical protein
MNLRVRIRVGFLLAGAVPLWSAGIAQAEMFKGFPDVIVCRVQNAQVVAFIAIVRDDGSAVYKALGGASATVTKDRVLHREGAKDCNGKTLDQLAKDGQTRDLK